jgi:hypothetical protein
MVPRQAAEPSTISCAEKEDRRTTRTGPLLEAGSRWDKARLWCGADFYPDSVDALDLGLVGGTIKQFTHLAFQKSALGPNRGMWCSPRPRVGIARRVVGV